MGLDVSITVTKDGLDFKKLYDVYFIVSEKFDWYLGDERSHRANRFNELVDVVDGITRMDVLNKCEAYSKELKELSAIPEPEFNSLLTLVKKSIGRYNPGNTHLFFNIDKLPGKDVFVSCSWNVRNKIAEAAMTEVPYDTHIVELDYGKMKRIVKDWKKLWFRLWFARVMTYIKPDSAETIFDDLVEDYPMCVGNYDLNDIFKLRKSMITILDGVSRTDRIWLVTSF